MNDCKKIDIKDYNLLYKWTIYQKPAEKSFDHFKESLQSRKEQIDEGKLDLNISPVLFASKKLFILYLDIEKIIDPLILKNIDIDYYYAYSGRGLHIYTNICTDYEYVLRYRSKLLNMFHNIDYIDMVTTLKITPFRFMSAFSEKHHIWLHPMKNESIAYAKKVAYENPSKIMPLDKYIERIINYFNNICYINFEMFENKLNQIKEIL